MNKKYTLLIIMFITLIISLMFLTGCGKKEYTVRIRKTASSENTDYEIKTYHFSQSQVKKGIKALPLAEKALKKLGKTPQDYAVKEEEFLEWTLNGNPCREYTVLTPETKHYDLNMFFKEKPTSSTIQYFTKTSNAPSSKEYGDFDIRLPLNQDGYDDYVFIGWRENDEGEIFTKFKFQMQKQTKHKMYAVYMKRSETAKVTMLRFADANPASFSETQVHHYVYTPLNKKLLQVDQIENPFLKNHNFNSWLLDGKEFNLKENEITKDIVLVPTFKIEEHQILTFKDGEKKYELRVFKEKLIKDSTGFAIPSATVPEGKEFICWTREDSLDNKPFSFDQYLTSDITLVPVFKDKTDTLFNIHLPNKVTERIIRPASEANFLLPVFQMPYNVFAGYFTDKEYTMPYSRKVTSPTPTEVNLYPQYFKILDLFKVRQIANSKNENIGYEIYELLNRNLIFNSHSLEIPQTISDNISSNKTIVSLSGPLFEGLNKLEDIIIHPSLQIIRSQKVFAGTKFIDSLSSESIIKFNNILFKATTDYDGGIPNSVSYITEGCFANNSKLAAISIPESCLGIGKEAFKGSSVTKVDLPKTIIALEEGVFRDCVTLETINLNNIKIIENDCFNNCSVLNDYDRYNEPLDLSTVTLFGDRAFKNCHKLAAVKISEKLNRYEYANLRHKDYPTRLIFGKELFRLTEFEYRAFNGIGTPQIYHRNMLIVNNILLQLNPNITDSEIFIGLNTAEAYGKIDAINAGAITGLTGKKIYLYPKKEKPDLGVELILTEAFISLENCEIYFPTGNANKYMANMFSKVNNCKAIIPFTKDTIPNYYEKEWDNGVLVEYDA